MPVEMSGAILGAGLAEKFKPSLDIGSCDFDCFRLGNGAAGSRAPQQRNLSVAAKSWIALVSRNQSLASRVQFHHFSGVRKRHRSFEGNDLFLLVSVGRAAIPVVGICDLPTL
jgi:hypothetical protein